MQRIYLSVAILSLLLGCTQQKPKQILDGEELLQQKCSKCHNLDMPPKSYENEIAPSMMGVTFHLKDFIKSNNPSEHEGKVVAFIKDYAINPSVDKAFCDKASLDSYGVMPSQKGNVTEDELEAIAHHMYKSYDNQMLLKAMAEKNRLAKMSLHERVLEQQRCNNCHDIKKDKVAPSFEMIASRYTAKEREMLIKHIKEGSKGHWEGKKLPMPSFKKMKDEDIAGMVDWILGLQK